MANLLCRTKYVNVVFRLLGYPNDFVKKLHEYIESNCSRYSYIEHSADINGYGELEGKHYHCVLVFKTAKRLSTYLNEFCDLFLLPNANGIEIDKLVSEVKSIQYLIHKNNPEKTQHNPSEIVTNIPQQELNTILDSEDDSCVTFEYIMKLIRDMGKYPNKMYLIKCLGLHTYKTYRPVILDILDEYQKGNYTW